MAENTIFVKIYPNDEDLFPVNETEVLRYSGYLGYDRGVDDGMWKVFLEVKEELKNAFAYKVCYRRMELKRQDGRIITPFVTESKDLYRHLSDCDEVIIFAATIGMNIDRSIARWQRLSPTKALFGQAYGAERVESLCDCFCAEMEQSIQAEGLHLTDRFSPGYGDLPLAIQKEFFALLDCNRQIGIALNDSLLMTPSKSVTAMMGVKKCKPSAKREGHNCKLCTKKDCAYRVE